MTHSAARRNAPNIRESDKGLAMRRQVDVFKVSSRITIDRFQGLRGTQWLRNRYYR